MKEHKNSNRREFLKNATLGVIGSNLLANNALAKPLTRFTRLTGVTSKISKIEVTLHKNEPNPKGLPASVFTTEK